MYKYFFYMIFSMLLIDLRLVAENNQPLNVIFVIPNNACEYITGGQILRLHDHLQASCDTFGRKGKNSVTIGYHNTDGHFSCAFAAPEGQTLQLGIYKNAERFPFSHACPGLDAHGFGCGNNSLTGEFEVLEIEYDENDNLIIFAADFELIGDHPNRPLRGAVRFNSSFPINEALMKIMDPSIKWESQQLFYVRKINAKTTEQAEIVRLDIFPLTPSLSEDNGSKVSVHEQGCYRNEITFYIPHLSAINISNPFIISPKMKGKIWSDWENKFIFNDNKSPGIKLEIPSERDIEAVKGTFTILEFIYDVKNNEILSLAIDFKFRDEKKNKYEGVIRYNSNVPVSPDFSLKE